MDKTVYTPWGVAQDVRVIADGITVYSTPSHGGIKLSHDLNQQVHESLRAEDGWYEEDCDWAIVAFTFPDHFSDYEREIAIQSLVNYRPNEYEAITGEVIPPGKSYAKDEARFDEMHRTDWVVVSAIISDTRPGMVLCTALQGGNRANLSSAHGEVREYLVPSSEYETRQPYGFVIDETRHERVTK